MGDLDDAFQKLTLRDSAENKKLKEELLKIRKRRLHVRRLQGRVQATQDAVAQQLWGDLRNQEQAIESYKAVNSEIRKNEAFLEMSSQWNVLNDTFHIWYSGPFATINGMRLGSEGTLLHVSGESTKKNSLSPKGGTANDAGGQPGSEKTAASIKIQWTEINSALGQVALLLSTLEQNPHAGIRYRYEIVPLGSTSRIGLRSTDGKPASLYQLYSDDGFQLFGRRNFNIALQSLLQCVRDAILVIRRRDPTISFPHAFERTNARVEEYTIGGLSVAYGTDGIEWTKAMKYLLTNIKYMLNYRAFGLSESVEVAAGAEKPNGQG